ncbi:MAG: hypothetical protein HDS82_00410 [Bacteroidales bacterium]|nr:hypothetical protein [Bacteroidales bacterium]
MSIATLSANAFTGTVKDEAGKPIEGAAVKVCAGDSVLSLSATDYTGKFFNNISGQDFTLSVNKDGYETFTTTPQGFNMGDIILKEKSTDLDELVVTPEKYMRDFDHKTFIWSPAKMERYSNVYSALGDLPGVTVTADGLTFNGRSGVTLLLNGIKITPAEAASLSKEDIRDIEIYDVPPTRFADANTTAVINIRTRRNITGGNTFISLNETPNPWYQSSNTLSSTYNYGKNRFNVRYSDNFSKNDKSNVDETIIYRTIDRTIEKNKTGLSNLSHANEHEFGASYLFSDPDGKEATQFNATFSGSASNIKNHNSASTVYSYGEKFLSENYSHEKLLNLSLDLYFHRTFGSRQLLLANVVATTYRGDNTSSYSEFVSKENEPAFDAATDYDVRNKSLIAEVIYQFTLRPRMVLDASGKYYLQRSDQTSLSELTSLTRHQGYLSVGYRWRTGPLFIFLKGQGSLFETRFNSGINNERRFDFLPMAYISWDCSSKVNVYMQLMRENISPTSSDMTSQRNVMDNGLVKTGNPDLHSFSRNYFYISQSFTTGKFQYSLGINYIYTPDKIVTAYSQQNDYVLERPVNAKSSHELLSTLFLRYRPIDALSFDLNGMLGKNFVTIDNNKYNVPTYRFNVSATYFTRRWEISANYQFPGHEAYGEMERRRLQAFGISCGYKPQESMMVRIGLTNPFYTGTEKITGINKDFIDYTRISYTEGFRNRITLSFSWNFSYGRRRVNDYKNISNSDEDTGLLK